MGLFNFLRPDEDYTVEVKSGIAYDANTEPVTNVRGRDSLEALDNFNLQTNNNSKLEDVIIRRKNG